VPHRVEIGAQVRRALERLDPPVRARVLGAVGELTGTPRPPDAKPLRGGPGPLRIRVGDCRVVYTVLDERLLVPVVRVGHRREVYR
jgi:mRNA interferase RelE/StbE